MGRKKWNRFGGNGSRIDFQRTHGALLGSKEGSALLGSADSIRISHKKMREGRGVGEFVCRFVQKRIDRRDRRKVRKVVLVPFVTVISQYIRNKGDANVRSETNSGMERKKDFFFEFKRSLNIPEGERPNELID